MISKNSKIYIAGHRGMAGSAIHRKLKEKGYFNFVTRTSKELDLTIQADVDGFFDKERPEIVILAAAKVGCKFRPNGVMISLRAVRAFRFNRCGYFG